MIDKFIYKFLGKIDSATSWINKLLKSKSKK